MSDSSGVRGLRLRWRMGLEARALVIVTAALVCFGLAVLYSASVLQALSAGSPGHTFVLRQVAGVSVGIAAFAILAKMDAELLRKYAWPIMGLSLLLMVAVFLPGTEKSHRFLFRRSIQPSELAKLAVLIWTPMLLVKKGTQVRQLGKGLLPFFVVIGTLSILAALEPDLSVAIMYLVLLWVLLLVGGARLSHFMLFGLVGLLLTGIQASQSEYVRRRIDAFLHRDRSEQEAVSSVDRQQYQSLVAVGAGGLTGVGFGQGNQQRGWLPLVYNDFIGSIVGEEFGFVGMAGLTLAFALYGWLGFRIARNARSPYLTLLAIGLTFTTVFTAFIHLAVVIRLLPNTGLTLPFVSYGRSNLVISLAMTGILVNIGSVRERVLGMAGGDPLDVTGS